MSVNESTLQLSVISLKERCLKQQKRIEDLERENDRLRLVVARSSGSSSGNEGSGNHESLVRQLEEANLQLRQRNLELTQALLSKNDSLNSIRYDPSLVSQNPNLESDFRSFSDECMEGEGLAEQAEVGEEVSLDKLEEQCQQKMMVLKKVLLDQQKKLMGLLRKDRCCPMCEAPFPEGQYSHQDFESHVMEHFSCEENGSMRHFDFMFDANSLDGEFG